jgi:hypothetical protein
MENTELMAPKRNKAMQKAGYDCAKNKPYREQA